MSRDLVIRPKAQADIDARIDYYDADAAERFAGELEHIFGRLLDFPHLGQVWDTLNPDQLAGVRYIVMRSFQLYVFYRLTAITIDIIRVLHQAQDIDPLLDEE